MFTDLLFNIAVGMAEKDGWNIPDASEIDSAKTIEDFVGLLIRHNPEKKELVEAKFNELKTLKK